MVIPVGDRVKNGKAPDIGGLLAGDEAALEILLERFGPAVISSCQRVLKSAGLPIDGSCGVDAQDCLQEALLRLIRHRAGLRFKDFDQAGQWLLRTAVNHCRDRVLQIRGNRPVTADRSSPPLRQRESRSQCDQDWQDAVGVREPEAAAYHSDHVAQQSIPDADLDDRIGQLYDEIAALAAQGDGVSGESRRQLDVAWEELRRLQAEEAAQYQEAFAASLSLPIGAGAAILEQSRELRRKLVRGELEDPASPDSAATVTDSPSS